MRIPLLNMHTQPAQSRNGATVSMETMQVVLDRYQTFYPQSAGE